MSHAQWHDHEAVDSEEIDSAMLHAAQKGINSILLAHTQGNADESL